MIEWLSTPTIKDCRYSLLCRLHHDILFNLDVPEQDGSRPISQDKLDEVFQGGIYHEKVIYCYVSRIGRSDRSAYFHLRP